MVIVDGDYAIFSTGKKLLVKCGIIAISEPTECGWQIVHGLDGILYVDDRMYHSSNFIELTKEEKIELADYMINLWQRFFNEG